MAEEVRAIYPSLRGRVVMVTGGASGIGAAHVEGFCRQGAKVAFVDIDETAAAGLVERIEARARPRFFRVDLANIPDLRVWRARRPNSDPSPCLSTTQRTTTATVSRT